MRVARLLLIVLSTACTPAAETELTSSPTLAESRMPTASSATEQPASATHAPVVLAPAGTLPPGSTAVVTVDGLRVRGGPPGSNEFDQIVAMLSEGDRVLVSPSPFSYLPPESSADGRGWYSVAVGGGHQDPAAVFGFVAQGETQLEFLMTETAPCPGLDPTLEQLLQFAEQGDYSAVDQAWDLLACFGNDSLELEGMIDLICLGDGMYPFAFEPSWLAYPSNCIGLGVDNPDASGFNLSQLPLRFPNGVYDGWERGDLVEVRGHFDDSAAASCRIVPPDFSGQRPEAAYLVLFCREQFVVDLLTVTGHHDLPPQY
jgi:hypothetical protein